ncbi:MAG TPA: hypothetical protein VJA86_00205 [Candidatus Nanoarchaeia archaeon]|nr:hypothetical protein [Candidatus Nanoarchaeia archaeon]
MIVHETIKSIEDLWKSDKELLKKQNHGIKIDWDASLPTDKEALDILVKQGENWQNPEKPIELNREFLRKTLAEIIPFLEDVWGEKYRKDFDFEIVSTEYFLQRINELEKKENALFGYGAESESPPTMGFFPIHARLVMPKNFLIRIPKRFSQENESYLKFLTSSGNSFEVIEKPWDKAYFEQAFCSQLSSALFRQLRGEWKEDYVKCMKSVGPDKEERIGRLNKVIAQYSNDQIALKNCNEWGLHVVGDKIRNIWADHRLREDYCAIDALCQTRRLERVALADDVFPQEKSIFVDFFLEHPSNLSKTEKFNYNKRY